MNLLLKDSNPKNDLIIKIFFVLFLVSLNLFIGSFLRENLQEIIWQSDDGVHLTIADNFRKHGEFFFDTTSEHRRAFSVDNLLERYPSATYPHLTKGPIYYIFLGGFYELTQPDHESLWIAGSIFNNLLTSTFLVSFFYLVNKKFNLHIAMLSSILLVFFPFFEWSSARIFLYPLMYIFSIIPLFFLGKKKLEYIIFGIFFGLSYLTHPFGLYLIISYNAFLLLKKEFKGFLIFNLVLLGIFIPWLLRNYYFFQDIGRGLYLPFTSTISKYLTFLPNLGNEFDLTPTFSKSVANIVLTDLSQPLPVFGVFTGILSEMTNFYHMGFITIFLLIFAGFSFISIEKITKNHVKNGLLVLSILIFVYFLANQYLDIEKKNDPLIFLQLFLFFILPSTLVILFYKFYNNLIIHPIPRIQLFILITCIVTIILVYFYATMSGRFIPIHKHFLFQMFLLLPLSLIGLEKIISAIFLSSTKFKFFANKKIIFSILIVFVGIMVFEMLQGLEQIDSHSENFMVENYDIKEANRILRESISTQDVVGTTHPYLTSQKTDLTSVVIPMFVYNSTDFARYIENYNIEYLVFYSAESDPLNDLWQERKKIILSWTFIKYFYVEVPLSGNTSLLEVHKILDADISHPVAYFVKATILEKNGNSIESKKILDELINIKPSDIEISRTLCNLATNTKELFIAKSHCENVLELDPTDLDSRTNLLMIYFDLKDEKKFKSHLQILLGYFNEKYLLETESFNLFTQLLLELRFSDSLFQTNIDNALTSILDHIIKLNDAENYHTTVLKLQKLSSYQIFKTIATENLINIAHWNNDFSLAKNACKDFTKSLTNDLNDYEKFRFPQHFTEIIDLNILFSECSSMYIKANELENKKRTNYDDYVEWHILTSDLFSTLINLPPIKNNSELRETSQSEFINYHFFNSETLRLIGEYREAERAINNVISEDRFNTELLAQKGKILESSGDFVRALETYEFANRFSDGKYDQKVDELKEKI